MRGKVKKALPGFQHRAKHYGYARVRHDLKVGLTKDLSRKDRFELLNLLGE